MVTRIRHDICILCLTANKNIQSILSTNDGISVEEKLKYIFPEFINFKPGKPAHICNDCLDDLNNAYKFKHKCSLNLTYYMNDIIPENNESCSFILTPSNTQYEQTPKSTNSKVKDEILESTIKETFTIKLEKQDLQEGAGIQCETLLFDETNSENVSFVKLKDDDNEAFANNNDETDMTCDPLLPENTVDKVLNGAAKNAEQPSATEEIKKVLYKCSKCRKIFLQKHFFTMHKCTGKKTYECEVCDAPFTSKDVLERHFREHKHNATYTCSYCGKKSTRKNNFIAHKRIHTGYKPFKCKQCGRRFNQKNHLTSHIRFHEKSTPLLCEICEKCFSTESELIRHNRMHPVASPCRCNICGVLFRTTNQMMLHRQMHSQYKCTHCNKAFVRKNSFESHMLVHSGYKPFKCDQCDVALPTSYRLSLHKRIHAKKLDNFAASS